MNMINMSISPPSLAYGPEPRVSVEATVIATGGNWAGSTWDKTHTGLIDNAGLAGTTADVQTYSKCGVSHRDSGKRSFLSMKLAAPNKVLRIQLASRTECCRYQGKNVRVQVGSSLQYNANDPVCKEIDQLTGTGLVDYECDTFHEGQYVILSNDQVYLTICEAKVFVEAGNLHHNTIIEMYSVIGAIKWSDAEFEPSIWRIHSLHLPNLNLCLGCMWGTWSTWEACSASCGGGSQERNRTVTQKAMHNGNDCTGNDTDTRVCNDHNCPGKKYSGLLQNMLRFENVAKNATFLENSMFPFLENITFSET